jgi:hypothetical protein
MINHIFRYYYKIKLGIGKIMKGKVKTTRYEQITWFWTWRWRA